MTDGQLIRVLGPDGNPQIVPFIKDWASVEYDIIVDESPTSPNKTREFTQMLLNSNFLPQMMQLGMPIPPEIMDLMELPESFKAAMRLSIQRQQEALAAQQMGGAMPPEGGIPQ
jgi:hypothetical protein